MAFAKSNKELFDVNGTVKAVAKTGKQICIKDDGGGEDMWFGVFTAEDLKGVGKGDVVEFKYSVSGSYNNISAKTFKIVKKVAPVNTVTAGGTTGNGGNGSFPNIGVEIGMSINNAVAIAIAEKDTSINHIKKLALDIYKMSSDMRDYVTEQKRAQAEEDAKKAAEAAQKAADAVKAAANEAPATISKTKAEPPKDLDDDIPF